MRARVAAILAAAVVVTAAVIAWHFLTPASAPASPAASPVPAPTPKVPVDAARTPAPAARATEPPPPKPTPAPTAAESATTGTLHITSDVPDTSVFIDRKFLGTAPVTVKDLTPGVHHLNMSATGYDGVFEDITVEAGEHDLAISFKEIKLDEKIGVVHKHLTGSCRGTLIATPQQLRYDTSDKNDGFSVALTDLERFEVDYLDKNLKLKLKKGKTYNFAEADGDVDKLYAFQKAVDKVRQKLNAR